MTPVDVSAQVGSIAPSGSWALPLGWKLVQLAEVVTASFGGGTPSTKNPRYWGGDIPWTTSAHLNGLYLRQGPKRITKLGLDGSSANLLPKGNLLVGTRVGVGKVAINLIDVAISQDLTGLVIDREKAHVEYLAYALMSGGPQAVFRSQTRGTTIKGIPREDLLKISVPLPPVGQQWRIARVLSAIQRAIEAQDKVIAAARELKRSLMKHLFTYGPVPITEASRVPLKETEIGPVPEHWQVVQLRSLFDIQQGKALSPKAREGKSPLAFLRTANVLWGRVDLTNLDSMDFTRDEMEKLRLSPGDLLVCEGGEVGRTAMWRGEIRECAHQNHIHRLRGENVDVEPEFYMYWMQAAIQLLGLYRGQGNNTTIPNLSKTRLGALAAPRPRLDEQRRIARVLSATQRAIEAEEKRKGALQALFKTMLHHLMTGRTRVPEEV